MSYTPGIEIEEGEKPLKKRTRRLVRTRRKVFTCDEYAILTEDLKAILLKALKINEDRIDDCSFRFYTEDGKNVQIRGVEVDHYYDERLDETGEVEI